MVQQKISREGGQHTYYFSTHGFSTTRVILGASLAPPPVNASMLASFQREREKGD